MHELRHPCAGVYLVRFLSSLGRVQWLASSTRLSCMMLQHELLVCGTQVFEVLKFLAPRCFSCVLSCISLPLAAGSLLFSGWRLSFSTVQKVMQLPLNSLWTLPVSQVFISTRFDGSICC